MSEREAPDEDELLAQALRRLFEEELKPGILESVRQTSQAASATFDKKIKDLAEGLAAKAAAERASAQSRVDKQLEAIGDQLKKLSSASASLPGKVEGLEREVQDRIAIAKAQNRDLQALIARMNALVGDEALEGGKRGKSRFGVSAPPPAAGDDLIEDDGGGAPVKKPRRRGMVWLTLGLCAAAFALGLAVQWLLPISGPVMASRADTTAGEAAPADLQYALGWRVLAQGGNGEATAAFAARCQGLSSACTFDEMWRDRIENRGEVTRLAQELLIYVDLARPECGIGPAAADGKLSRATARALNRSIDCLGLNLAKSPEDAPRPIGDEEIHTLLDAVAKWPPSAITPQ